MSQYISSYLIEPVARRLSRSTSASEPSDPQAASSRPSSFPLGAGNISMRDGNEAAIDDSQVDEPVSSDPAHSDPSVAPTRPSSSPVSESRSLRHAARPQYRTNEEAGLERSGGHSESPFRHRRSSTAHANTDRLQRPLVSTTPGWTRGTELRREWRTSQPRSLEQATAGRSGSVRGQLPEDDGMGVLRRKILAVQTSDRPVHEKSRLIHALMTERYSALRATAPSPGSRRSRSPVSTSSADRPATPGSACSLVETSSPGTSCSLQGSPTIHASAEDRQATYWIPPEQSTSQKPTPTNERSDPVLGCAHYKRNVKLQCSTCTRWYTCRFCHDGVEDHGLKRHETRNMLCMLCGSAQPAAEQCRECEQPAAWYYCHLCKLWDNDPEKSIYHCDDCGICRVGKGLGKDFFHCQKCSACLSIAIRESHRCIERSTDCDCPICGEYMFTSPQTVVFMPCGHSIHYSCYNQHVQTSYKCPLCNRSLGNMEMAFREIERAIESQPMPRQYADTRVWIGCNDCCGKSFVRFHWLGLKCTICDSYNTVQLQMDHDPATGDEATDPLSSEGLSANGSALNSWRPPSEARERPINRLRLNSSPRRSSLLRAASAHRSGLDRRGLHRTNSLPTPAMLSLPQDSHIALDLPRSRSPSEAESSSPHGEDDVRSEVTSEQSDSDDADDVDFWGGESPRSGAAAAGRWPQEDLDMLDSDESGDQSDASNGSADDSEEGRADEGDVDDGDDDNDDDGIDIGVGFGPGSIELIGHR